MSGMIYNLYKKFSKKRIANTCCYCFISNGYDKLQSPKYIRYDWDYVCFTDDKKLLAHKRVGVWQIRPALETSFDTKRNSGWHKTHPEICCAGYDYSVWVDANVIVKRKYLYKQIRFRNQTILTPIHNERDCIYDELDICKKYNRDNTDDINRMIVFLKECEMPRHYGLNETNIMFRAHNDSNVLSIDKMWWDMIQEYCKRDQLSFSYVLYKHGITPNDIAINNTRVDKKDFYVKKHKKREVV